MNNGHLVREPATLNSCVPVVQHIIEGLSANIQKNLKYNNTSQRFRND